MEAVAGDLQSKESWPTRSKETDAMNWEDECPAREERETCDEYYKAW